MPTPHSLKAAVASGHPLVSDAACELLRGGGNAFDAIVAAGFAAALAEPALTSLGGGGFLLARTAAGKATLFDFFVDTPGHGLSDDALEPHFVAVTVRFPGSDQIFNTGLGSAAAPGNLLGFLHVHQRLGQAPLAKVLEPAIRMASEGIALSEQQARFMHLLKPIMTLTSAARALYAPQGHLIGAGERFCNPQLAEFLHGLPRDRGNSFYHGELARRIDADMRANQGLLTAADLKAYRVIEREPLAVDYRGSTLLTNPLPSFGGALIGLSLRLLRAAEKLPPFGSAEHLTLLATVLTETTRHREAYLSETLSAGLLAASGERVRTAGGFSGRLFRRGTTHVSVCDAQGNIASMTISNGEGSGYLVPGTGIMLNNMMGEDDLHPDGFHSSPPGQRVGSMMAPSALLQDNQVKLVLGSGGSKRIRSAILQVLSNVVDYGMALPEAIMAARMHWENDQLQLEPGFAEASLVPLRQSWPVNIWTVQDMYFGGVHAIAPGGRIKAQAVGDPRRDGCAVVLD